MHRFLAGLGVAAMAACGTSTDDRPRTVEYVTAAVLTPHCANAECHSAFKQESGWAFDSVEHVITGAQAGVLAPGDADSSLLYLVLVRDKDRMPYDSPLPQADIALIRDWINEGADGIPTP